MPWSLAFPLMAHRSNSCLARTDREAVQQVPSDPRQTGRPNQCHDQSSKGQQSPQDLSRPKELVPPTWTTVWMQQLYPTWQSSALHLAKRASSVATRPSRSRQPQGASHVGLGPTAVSALSRQSQDASPETQNALPIGAIDPASAPTERIAEDQPEVAARVHQVPPTVSSARLRPLLRKSSDPHALVRPLAILAVEPGC